jgi:hypothetical protein
MRRVVAILFAGVIGAVVAYSAIYFLRTNRERHLMESEQPELTWLKQEFQISDAEFKRISELHDAYLGNCGEMCARIAAKHSELKRLLAQTNAVTPEVQRNLAEAAQLRAECQRNMLEHFVQVSKQMPPEQGRRYLAWVQEKTLGGMGAMISQQSEQQSRHEQHH